MRPSFLSQTPKTLELQDPRGDVLADVLGVALLRNALYRTIEAGAPWGMRAPTRDRAVFYLVARGSALMEVEGERPVTLSAGDVAFIPHGTAHTLRDASTTEPVPVCDGSRCATARVSANRKIGGKGPKTTLFAGFFERNEGARPALLERMPKAVVLSPMDGTARPWIAATVQLVLAETSNPGPASTLVLQRLADVLFIQALRSLTSRGECSGGGIAALSDPPVHQALTLIHARVHEPWTVAKLASRVGLSRSGFASRFTELVGDPPLQYLARWRMARAGELLRDTNESVGQVAERVGYESVPSFCKAFKRWQKTSPLAFRRAHLKARESQQV